VTAVTPGQALHDSLLQSAVTHFGLPVEQFEAWDHMPAQQQKRMEDAGKAAVDAARLRQPEELRQAMAETRALAGHLDLATRLMLDLGGDELAASARRIRKAAGLET
jgi:hypothetical protein